MPIAADKTDATPTLVDHAAHHNALATAANLAEVHGADTANPHGVTKAQVGLGSVDNTADSAKPISSAQQAALDAKAPLASPALTGTPTAPTAPPGTITTQIASTAFAAAGFALAIPLTQKAAVSGVASLDGSSRVVQSPKLHAADHQPGGSDAMTVDAAAATGSLRTLGVGAAQAAQGSVVATHQADIANPHAVTKAQVGLGSVDNTADTAKPVSTAQTAAFAPQMPALVVPAVISCITAIAGSLQTFTVLKVYTLRAIIAKAGNLRDLAIYVGGTSAGNIRVLVLSTASTRLVLADSGSIACPAANAWRIAYDPNLAVSAGQAVELAFMTDSATANFLAVGAVSSAVPTLPTGFFPVSGGALPKLICATAAQASLGADLSAGIAEASMAANFNAPYMIGRIS